jgi:signal transduction histidine kinase/CheY-like chemotaxis protein
MFWFFPLALRMWPNMYSWLAITSVANLNFAILITSFHFGGASSPFLMWFLVTPLLAFFYLGSGFRTSAAIFSQMVVGVGVFYGMYLMDGSFPQHIPLSQMVGVTMISLICASMYIFFMSSYYASVVDSQSELLREIDRHQATLDDLKTAKEEAERANGAKSDFLAKMSHELRTPLNAVLGYSEILLEDAELDGNGEQIADLQKISAAGKHLLAMVNDILDISKIEAGKTELYVEEVDVDQLLNEIEMTARPLAAKNTNTFVIEKTGELGKAQIDLTKSRQAIFNLLSNASKFCQNGKIEMHVARKDIDGVAMLEFAVSDTGVGISEDALTTLFENFSQANAAVNAKFGGTGLGLSLSRNLCRLMGGDITATSVLGQGSTFTVHLPVCVSSENSASESNEEIAEQVDEALVTAAADLRAFQQGDAGIAANSVPASAQKVLVIDDDKEYLSLVDRILRKEGYSPILTDQPSSALQLARAVKPDLIMLDVLMPEIDGWTVVDDLKKSPETASIPLIMVSVIDDPQTGSTNRAEAFIPKPVDSKQLSKTIKSLLQKSAA